MEVSCEKDIDSWGCSSGVEHLTADQEVPGSNPGAPFVMIVFSLQWKLFIPPSSVEALPHGI